MSERHTLLLTNWNRRQAHAWVDAAIAKDRSGKPWVMEVREGNRTDEQNNAVHGLIDQVLKARPFHCGLRMSKESYKAIFMHALGREARMLPTLDGDGLFPLGLSTSKLTISECRDLIEFILAWCAKEGIEIHHFDEGSQGGAGAKNLRAEAA